MEPAVDEAWRAQGCVESERFVRPGEPGRFLPHSKRQYNLRCGADNPTGLVAVIGDYEEARDALKDAKSYKRGGACATQRLVVIGYFYSFTSDRSAPEVDTATQGTKGLCKRLHGVYVR